MEAEWKKTIFLCFDIRGGCHVIVEILVNPLCHLTYPIAIIPLCVKVFVNNYADVS